MNKPIKSIVLFLILLWLVGLPKIVFSQQVEDEAPTVIYLPMIVQETVGEINSASVQSTNIAVNQSRSGFPHPLESDAGWGGGNDVWDVIDGQVYYDWWANGLALLPGGTRQITIDLETVKRFEKVVIWHHRDCCELGHNIPADVKLEYFDGVNWQDITFARTYSVVDSAPSGFYGAAEDTYIFPPVSGSKVRWSYNGSGPSVTGATSNWHGWIYEFEVFGVDTCDTGVVRWSQSDPLWVNENYDHRDSLHKDPFGRYTIGQLGCNLTTLAMQLRAAGASLLPDGTTLTPFALNHWMNNNNGYNANHDVKQAETVRSVLGGAWSWRIHHGPNTVNELKHLICEGNKGNPTPVMVGVRTTSAACAAKPGVACHFVVATGVDSQGNITIADPASRNYTRLNQYGTWMQIRGFAMDPENLSSLSIRTTDAISLTLSDDSGRNTSVTINEIPQSNYFREIFATGGIDDPASETPPATLQPNQSIEVTQPESSAYAILIEGQDPRLYTLIISGVSKTGNPYSDRIINGIVSPTTPSTVFIDFSDDDNSPPTIIRTVTFETAINDVRGLEELELIHQPGIATAIERRIRNAEKSIEQGHLLVGKDMLEKLKEFVSGLSEQHISIEAKQVLVDDINSLLLR